MNFKNYWLLHNRACFPLLIGNVLLKLIQKILKTIILILQRMYKDPIVIENSTELNVYIEQLDIVEYIIFFIDFIIKIIFILNICC